MFRSLKIISLCLIIFFTLQNASLNAADNKSKAIRIGVDLGVPYLYGFNAEYLTPLADNKIAPQAFFSYIPLSGLVDLKANQSGTIYYWSLGVNYYPMTKNGTGVYTGILYANLSATAEETGLNGYYTQEGTNNTVLITDGTGKASVGTSMLMLKVGYRFVWGFFTLAPELAAGYSFGANSATYKITSNGKSYTGDTKLDSPISAGKVISLGVLLGFAF